MASSTAMASEMSERIAMARDYLLARGVPEAEIDYVVNYEGARWLAVSFDVLLGETIAEIEAGQGGDVVRIECASGLRLRCGYYGENVRVVCDGLFPREANTDG